MVVKSLPVIPVTALDRAVMPGRSRPEKLVSDVCLPTEHVQWMDSLRFANVSEFRTVVSLNRLRSVSEESDGPFDEINSAVAAFLKIGRDEPLS